MKRTKIVSTYQDNYQGEKVEVKVLTPKEKSSKKNRSKTTSICPECNSILKLNEVGVWECTGNELEHWHQQFTKFRVKSEEEQVKYLKSVSDTGQFIDLYNRWVNYQELKDTIFDCGYTNKMYPSHSNSKDIIPDPIQVSNIERKLGRKLTEEELRNEDDIWNFGGQYLTKYKKGAKKVRIKYIIFPDEAY